MPIEIKELHIKAVVAARENVPSGVGEGFTRNQYDRMRRELTNDCVEKILQILAKRERG